MSEEFSYSSEGVVQEGATIPDGEYTLKVHSVKLLKNKKTGFPMVIVTENVDGGNHNGFAVTQYVTFPPPDALNADKQRSRALSFLNAIGEPSTGNFKVSPANWHGKRFIGYLKASEYGGIISMGVLWFKSAPAIATIEDVPF